MKDGYLRKPKKHDLAKEIEKELEVLALSDVPRSNHTTMIAIDFIAYVRRVPVAELKLAAYGAFFEHLSGHTYQFVKRVQKNGYYIWLVSPKEHKEYESNRRGKLDAIIKLLPLRDWISHYQLTWTDSGHQQK